MAHFLRFWEFLLIWCLGYNVLNDKFYSEEFLQEKAEKDLEFLKQFDDLKSKVDMIDLGIKLKNKKISENTENNKTSTKNDQSEATNPKFKLFYVKQGEESSKLEAQSVEFFSEEAEKIKQLQNSSNLKEFIAENESRGTEHSKDFGMNKMRNMVDEIDSYRYTAVNNATEMDSGLEK